MLKEERKKNKLLKEENDQLLNDIIKIKTNIKSHIPCIPQNKSYPFPSLEELSKHILNFINSDTVKFFNRLQNKNSYPIDVIICYFKEIFEKVNELIVKHFSNVNEILFNMFKNN